jgi:hypothetical protein
MARAFNGGVSLDRGQTSLVLAVAQRNTPAVPVLGMNGPSSFKKKETFF